MRFIIFSLARCGSTTLMRALNCYPGVRCALEPFIPAHEYGAVRGAAGLDIALTQIWRDYTGIKHVWGPAGWPFGTAHELNHRLLLNTDARIILLTRRNQLRRVISSEISWQTSIWGDFTEAERERVRGYSFQPVDLAKVSRQISAAVTATEEIRRLLREASIGFCDLYYEDLFCPDLYLAERLSVMDKLRTFIGVGDDRGIQADFAIAELLNPERSKLNLTETYKHIPNITEVERLLGSDELGWVFD